MLVGTGDVPSTRSFYEHCGFTISHRVENFLPTIMTTLCMKTVNNLVDMVYLKKTF